MFDLSPVGGKLNDGAVVLERKALEKFSRRGGKRGENKRGAEARSESGPHHNIALRYYFSPHELEACAETPPCWRLD